MRPFLLGLVGLLGTAGFSSAQNAFSVNVGGVTNTYATFQDAIYAANAATIAATLSIDHDLTGGTVSLTSQLVIGLNENNSGGLTIQGNGVTIDMNKADRAFFIASGTVNLTGMTIANGLAKGGVGGNAGGGGAGLGGAIFVANPETITSSGISGGFTNANLVQPTAVTLTGVSFTNNVATGGGSQLQNEGSGYQSGGGGGMGGNGGSGVTNDFSVIGGGGGGFGNGAAGGTYNNGDGPWHGSDGAMIFTASPVSAAPIGGPGAGETDNGGNFGGGGGMGQNDDFDDQAGGGGGANGVGGDASSGGAGGFGGGGGGSPSYSGAGGQGGFGGGGGASVEIESGQNPIPGNGGFGGGGGASTTANFGTGGFAAGNGFAFGPDVVGGFGASLGGAIFVMKGAGLTIQSGNFNSNQALIPVSASTVGYGDDLFLGGDVILDVAADETVSLQNLGGAGNVSDPNVSRNQGDPEAQGGITVQGGGTVELRGANNFYTGQTVVNAGTLALANGAAETGTASVVVGQALGDSAALTLGSNARLVLAGFNVNAPQSSTDTAVEIAQAEDSEGSIVIGNGVGSGGAFIGARLFKGGDGDASVEFQQNYAVGSTTNTTYEFNSTLTGSINLFQSGPGTTLLNPQFGYNSFTGAVFITGGALATTGSVAALGGVAQITLDGGDFVIGQSNGISNAAELNQGNGTLRVGINGLVQQFGDWIISDSTILDFNHFAGNLSFSSLDIGGSLSIFNYNPSIDFLTVFSGSAVGDLSQISFYSDAGNTLLGTGGFNGTSLVAVPEPALESLLVLGAAVLGFLERRNRAARSVLTSSSPRG